MIKKISVGVIVSGFVGLVMYGFYYQNTRIAELQVNLTKAANEVVVNSVAWKVFLTTMTQDQQTVFVNAVQSELTKLK